MKAHSFLLILFCLCSALMVSCSSDRFDDIPHTGFITHYQRPIDKRVPFASCWFRQSDRNWDEGVAGKASHSFYYAPITLNYLYRDPQNPLTPQEEQGLRELCRYNDTQLRKALTALSADPNNHFTLAKAPGPGVYRVETAIIMAVPTRISRNALYDAAGAVTQLPVGMVLSDKDDKGCLGIAARVYDDKGKLVYEIADLRSGRSSLLGMATVDLRNYSNFAFHRAIIDDWIAESTKLLTTPASYNVRKTPMHLFW